MRSLLTLLLSTLVFTVASAGITLHCPPDVTLPCTAQSTNLNAYGTAHLMKDGVKYPAGLPYVEYNLNSCNVGFIKRKWQAEDEDWNLIECIQYIYFQPGNFNVLNIQWPESELLVAGCEAEIVPDSLPAGYQRPTWDYLTCSNIAYSYKDRDFEFGPDCIKILREWTIIDWCKYTPGSNTEGIWKHTQVFKLSNTAEPVLSCAKEVVVNTLDCDSARVSVPLPFADGTPCKGSYTIKHHSPFADTTGNDATGTYPIGVTEFYYTMDYSCGASKSCLTRVNVNQENKPVPYCLSTINVALMGVDTDQDGLVDDGMVEIWAKDANVNSYHPCNGGSLHYSFSSDTSDMVQVFTCEDVGYNTLEMWVTDSNGDQAFCRFNLLVQNNAANIPDCDPDPQLRKLAAGRVVDAMGIPVEGVRISFSDMQESDVMVRAEQNQAHRFSKFMTDSEGYYEGNNVTIGRNFMVEAYKVGDLSGVDQEDISILENHVLGTALFTNPYTYFAADINQDGAVNIDDLHLLKNLINASEDDWPNQRQRTFYFKPAMDEMSTLPLNDEIPQYHEIHYLHYGNGDKVDFISILKGDLSLYENMP